MINLVISGRVGNDCKELENSAVFNIASTKKGYKKQDGSVIEDKTIWLSVFCNKKLAPYIKKGDSLCVSTDFINTHVHEGNAQLSCNALNIEFMGKANQQSQSHHEQNDLDKTMNQPEPEEDNLPF